MTGYSDTQTELMKLISAALFDGTWEAPEELCWSELYREAIQQSVFPMIYPVVEKSLPSEERSRWSGTFYLGMEKNLRICYEHTELDGLLGQAGIPYVILKGVASAGYYPEPGLRTMGDVDFLVRREDVARTRRILTSAGFVQIGSEADWQTGQEDEECASCDDLCGIHAGYRRESVDGSMVSVWELHWSVNGVPDGSAGACISAYLSDLIETVEDREISGGIVKVPDAFHHGLILLLHTAAHMTTEGIGLRHLCDWMVFADHFSESEFTAIFEEKLKKAGLWNFAQLLTLCGVRFLGCPPRAWAGEASEQLLDAMIWDIIDAGNFGKKDMDRYRQMKYIANRDRRTVDNKGVVRQSLASVDYKARIEYDFVKRHPFLLPIGWICVLLQYVGMVLRGERRMDRKSTLEQAAVRKRIYREFHLFEP